LLVRSRSPESELTRDSVGEAIDRIEDLIRELLETISSSPTRLPPRLAEAPRWRRLSRGSEGGRRLVGWRHEIAAGLSGRRLVWAQPIGWLGALTIFRIVG